MVAASNLKQEHRDQFRIELSNAITHGIGVILGIVFLLLLLLRKSTADAPLRIVAYAIYGGCFIFLFLASTIYHAIPIPKARAVLRIFDHVAIYLFIAGSFTPPILLVLHGRVQRILLVVIWSIAIAGTIFKAITFRHYDQLKLVSVLIYIGMGWLGMFLVKPLVSQRPLPLMILILIGGVLYTIGTIFYSNKSLKYHHVIWHLFVLAAAIVHFTAYYLYL